MMMKESYAWANTEDTTINVTYVWHMMGWVIKYAIYGFPVFWLAVSYGMV